MCALDILLRTQDAQLDAIKSNLIRLAAVTETVFRLAAADVTALATYVQLCLEDDPRLAIVDFGYSSFFGVSAVDGREPGSDVFGRPWNSVVYQHGVNSMVRRAFEGDFDTTLSYLQNKFVWYGTTKPFETLTQTFIATETGTFNAHHYRYAPGISTFIVECDRATWLRSGLHEAGEDESRVLCERVFRQALDGHRLVSNRSLWRSFPWIWNGRWSYRNCVLIGDALRTAHYSIGSGTRLALEDALALAKALEAEPDDLPGGLRRFEADRRPIVEKLVTASRRSAAWYDRFFEHMRLEPLDLAMSYITRSGRVDADRLRAASPQFMQLYETRAGSAR